jgi:GTP-binding protein
VLVHVVDVSGASGRNPIDDLDTVRQELQLFQPTLAAKPQVVAANKMDAVSDTTEVDALALRASELALPFFRISAVTGAGVPDLLEAAWLRLAEARAIAAAAAPLERIGTPNNGSAVATVHTVSAEDTGEAAIDIPSDPTV